MHTLLPEDLKTAEELVEIVDFYLYKAKEEGRNRIYAEQGRVNNNQSKH